MEQMLEVNNVSKHYGKHIALSGVSLSVPKGSIYGLLGPNGAGKTSLIRIINRITAPDSGEIFLDGTPLQSADHKKVGYLPEERGLYRKMKVREQAMYLARIRGLSKKEASEKLDYWFNRFEITSWWNKKVEELSKGMAQKLQFIVTVLHEPDLLILDEPFSGFDPINVNLIKQEILQLNKKGTTIIFSTHNMASVEEICNHIALIHQSQALLEGEVRAIKQKHKQGIFDLTFAGNVIALTNALWTGFELVQVESEDQHHKARIRLLNNRTSNDLLKCALASVEVQGLQEVVPSINDIFMDTVNGSHQENDAA